MRPQGDDEPARRRGRACGRVGRADRDRRQRPLRRLVPPPFLRAVAGKRGAPAEPQARPPLMLHGWINLDKPVGLGSTQAVGAVKRILREAGEPKTKVGHGGTLDPLASGVLPIALGEATKLAGRMLDATKQYELTIRFGEQTDTLDSEGVVIATSEARPTLAQIEAALPRFTGPIEQIPPAYSALKIGGKPAYARARAGEE